MLEGLATGEVSISYHFLSFSIDIVAEYCNDQDQILEGAISNIYVQIDQTWFTPPIALGVLPGVMRSYLMAHPAWQVQERILTRNDLMQASNIAISNGVQGVRLAKWFETSA